MRHVDDRFEEPPHTHTEEGRLRRVGFELEFKKLDLRPAGDVVQRLFGGRIVRNEPFVHHVRHTRYGDFRLELDWALLKDHTLERRMRDLGADGLLTDRIVRLIGEAAGALVPNEIATPPVPLDRLHDMDLLRAALHKEGAHGTGAPPFYALGLHINPDVARSDPDSLLAILRAFNILHDAIASDAQIDLSRRIAPFIDPFPPGYKDVILDPSYRPRRDQLIDDYIEHNPTRNRALDMLPLFAHLDRRRVFAQVQDRLVSARPAFHYRLADCAIDDPDWRIAHEWNRWVAVERLAADAGRLRAAMERHEEEKESTLGGLLR